MGLYIEAIFNSIDGEANCFYGAGQLCTFIRLKGCNLKCRYCDTSYAQEKGEGEEGLMEVDDIVYWEEMLDKVTLTGGEPLSQGRKEVEALVFALLCTGKKVTIETNGTYLPIVLPTTRTISQIQNLRHVVDYKLPSSGMEDKMKSEVFKSLTPFDIVKFVISDFDDYYVARGLVASNEWSAARKVFSPAIDDQHDYTGWPAALVQMMISDAKVLGDVQFSLQLHKILWPDAKAER